MLLCRSFSHHCCLHDDKLLQNAILVCCFSYSTSVGSCRSPLNGLHLGFFFLLLFHSVYVNFLFIVNAQNEDVNKSKKQKVSSAQCIIYVILRTLFNSDRRLQYNILQLSSKFNQKIAISFYDWKTIKEKCRCWSAPSGEKKINQYFNIAKIGLLPSYHPTPFLPVAPTPPILSQCPANGSTGRWELQAPANGNDNERFNAMKVNGWNKKKTKEIKMIRTKIQWSQSKSIDEMKSGTVDERTNERAVLSFTGTRTRRHIFYSWTIKMFCEKSLAQCACLFFFLSSRTHFFLLLSLRALPTIISSNGCASPTNSYRWLFLFRVFTFLVFCFPLDASRSHRRKISYKRRKEGRKNEKKSDGMALIWMAKRRWIWWRRRQRWRRRSSVRARIDTLMAYATMSQWIVKKCALVVCAQWRNSYPEHKAKQSKEMQWKKFYFK